MNNYSYIPTLLTSLSIIIFLGLIVRRLTVPLYRALALLCVNTLWWHGSWVFLFLTRNEATAATIAKVGHIGILGLPMTFHYFYAKLVGKGESFAITKVVVYLVLVVCLFFTPWVIDGVYTFPWGFYPRASYLHPVYLLAVNFFILHGLWLSYVALRGTQDESQARVLRICQIGGIIYSIAAVDFLLNYNLSSTYPFGFVFSLIFLACITYAVFNSDLFSTEEKLKVVTKQNKDLEAALKEIEYLKNNLELEVEKKTAELKENQIMLVQQEKMAALGTLSAGIAHELNNALNRISGGVGAIKALTASISKSEDQKRDLDEVIEIMKKGLKLSIEIINNLKSYSRQDQGELTCINLFENVTMVCSLLKSKIGLSIEVVINIPKEMQIVANRAGMIQLLSNLVSNSVDALPNATGVVSINASQNADNWVLSVSDTGVGIPKKFINRIFDPFFTTKEIGKGTGLGLFIVHKEVERHKGTMAIESEENKGTTFNFVFPILAESKKTEDSI